jgi:hypothetical protein
MRKYIFFLKCSSVVVKITAWILLFLGIAGAVNLFSGASQGAPRWAGAVILVLYAFFFGVLFLIAKLADILVEVINTIQKE